MEESRLMHFACYPLQDALLVTLKGSFVLRQNCFKLPVFLVKVTDSFDEEYIWSGMDICSDCYWNKIPDEVLGALELVNGKAGTAWHYDEYADYQIRGET